MVTPRVDVDVLKLREGSVLHALVAGVVLKAARFVGNPVPRYTAVLADVGQRVVQILVRASCTG